MKNNDLNLEDILSDVASEEDLMEVPLADRVFKIFLFITIAVVFVAFLQLMNIGLLKQEFYKKRAFLNMSQTKVSSAPRGLIFDRFGEPLLHNEPSFNVFIDPGGLPKNKDDAFVVLGKVSDI